MIRKVLPFKYKKQILLLIFTSFTAFILSAYFIQLMMIQGCSMYPSYHNLQLVAVDKYHKTFQRGDVIAFKCEAVNTLLVKRIVAVPGDTVQIVDGRLYVNDELDIRSCSKGSIVYPGIARNSVMLAEDEYFVLGDNYEYSKDSRYEEIGCVVRKHIVGKVMPNLGDK